MEGGVEPSGEQEHLQRGETASARMLPGTEPSRGVGQDVAEGQGCVASQETWDLATSLEAP